MKRTPAPPFTTSTLQQEAARKLGFTVSQTMMMAQRLYENGLITYMRTDSVNLSSLCIGACKEEIKKLWGEEYSKVRQYHTNSKGAVKAYVGGLDYRHFMYDMVTGGRRQVGSTIKPFLYSLAMENGFSPCDLAPNVQRTYMVAGQPWTPRNASHKRAGEMVTLKWGLAQSSNWVSAYSVCGQCGSLF